MRILNLHEVSDIRGGAEVYIRQLHEYLPAYGCEPFWIGVNDFLGSFSVSLFQGSDTHNFTRLRQVLEYLRSFISEKHIDIICIHNIFNSDIIRFCLQLRPVIKFSHSPVMVCPGKEKFWRYSEKPCTVKVGIHCFMHIYTQGCSNRNPKRVLKSWNHVQFELGEAARKYAGIVVMSEYIKNGLLQCNVDSSKVLLNPYFTPVIEEPCTSPVSDRKKILFVGRLISSKGPHIMLQSLIPLLEKRDDIHLEIIGDGIMREEIRQIVEKSNLDHKITLSGWKDRDQINDAINNCYLVIFPSIYPEAFGIVGIEAMMRAKPVVAFNVGGVDTWLKDGVTGYLVDAHDTEAMRNRTEELLNNEVLYRTMATEARKQAVEHYTVDVHMIKLMKLFNNCIS